MNLEGVMSWAGLLLATPGLLKGEGFEESHHFCVMCVDLHTNSHAPLLADM